MKKLIVLLFSVALASALLAAEPSVTGTWKFDTDTAGNLSSSTIMLKQDGTKVAGTMKGDDDNVTPIKGEFDGKKLTLRFQSEWSGNKLDITYAGTLDANGALSGSIEVQPMGIEGTFTAKRIVPAAK